MAWRSRNYLLVCLVGALATLAEYVFIPRRDISKWFTYASK